MAHRAPFWHLSLCIGYGYWVRTRLDLGYGLCFGHNERKAIAMANLDVAARRAGPDDTLGQILLLTLDGLDSGGFLDHLKLPHYVTFRSIVDRRSYGIAAGSGHHAYFWLNLNPMLGVYRGAIGIKTGYTPAAGHCLLFEVTRRGATFIGVTLDSPGVGTTVNGADATQMLNWAFSLPGR